MTFLSLPINLPPLILVHSLFLTGLGLSMLFRSPMTGSPSRYDPAREARGMSGLVITALGIAYLATSYMPIEENQFLFASIPVRIGLALLAGLRLLLVPGLTGDGRGEMWFVLLYDGLGGALCGWMLGRWDGRVDGY